jgi:myo-inositol-1(or 4)-monophosphatase
MMHPLINIAIKAARSASKLIVQALDKLDTISIHEKNHNDFVTEIDKLSELEIINTIHKAYPNHAILSEESGKSGENEYTWIIDPLDGTTNFIHGMPHFSISIAVKFNESLEHGVIFDPLRQEFFIASRGYGAFLNDHRIRVSKRSHLDGALVGTGFGMRDPNNLQLHVKALTALLPRAAGIRRSGSAALDFAYVACGRLDCFWELNLAPWDIAAGALIVKEAGGFVTDINDKNTFLESGNVLAGNPKIHHELVKVFQQCS